MNEPASVWLQRKVEDEAAEFLQRRELCELYKQGFAAGMRRAAEYLEEYERTVKPYER